MISFSEVGYKIVYPWQHCNNTMIGTGKTVPSRCGVYINEMLPASNYCVVFFIGDVKFKFKTILLKLILLQVNDT